MLIIILLLFYLNFYCYHDQFYMLTIIHRIYILQYNIDINIINLLLKQVQIHHNDHYKFVCHCKNSYTGINIF